ncbi:hypothetical protein Tco_1131694 [Tanacetum coccineum]|uniref:Uncharacterized protein n=1 Tax=Tanacetum coccineum TaxID=301880 RepID=A0ABQ5JCT0_9ASTR
MIPGTDLHCFDVHNDGYFAHLPLRYADGGILNMSVSRSLTKSLLNLWKKIVETTFKTFSRLNLYLNHLDMNLLEYLSQAITTEMDADVSKIIGSHKKRYCNDFFMDEMVD